MNVLIVGAGPTGLVLACDLARRGISCSIIEQNPVPQSGSRGVTLKPKSLEILQDLGVGKEIQQASRTETQIAMFLNERLLTSITLPSASSNDIRPFPRTVYLPEERTEAILRSRLTRLGVSVQFETTLTDIRQSDTHVTAYVRHGGKEQEITADYVVGADGGHSTVRHLLGLNFGGSTDEDTRAMLADVKVKGLDRAQTYVWLSHQGMLALRPLPDPYQWQIVAALSPDSHDITEPSLAYLQSAVKNRTGNVEILLSEPTWMSIWRYNRRMVDQYRSGRVFLAGDAAHIHSPFGGYGMNTGIQDAYNLSWKLALVCKGLADPSLLDTYDEERLPVARRILAESDMKFSRATKPPQFVLSIIGKFIKPYILRQKKLELDDHPRYYTSSLTYQSAPTKKLKAGDTIPNYPLYLANEQQPNSLWDIIRSDIRPTMFICSDDAETVSRYREQYGFSMAVHVIGSDEGQQFRRFAGCADDFILVVRPDYYIAAITQPSNVEIPGLPLLLQMSTG